MDPRKKKGDSLKHDRRNTYGENDKSSRKSIRRRKQWVNKSYRRKVKQALGTKDSDSTEDQAAGIRRPDWKKSPDQPLGDVLLDDLIRDIKAVVCSESFEPILFDRLEERMEKQGWETPGIRVVVRRLKAVRMARWSGKLNLDLQTARELAKLLGEIPADIPDVRDAA